MILLIDNYDSFTYNLYQYVSEIERDVKVVRNDAITLQAIAQLQPDFIIFSPGPGYPRQAGIMEDIIQAFYKQIPMLGICLGHQAIGEVFGCQIQPAKEMKHGEVDDIQVNSLSPLFKDLTNTLRVARYHSLIVAHPSSELEVIATSNQGEIMAIQHKHYPLYGVQFHPESIMTPKGKQILYNFIKGEQHNVKKLY